MSLRATEQQVKRLESLLLPWMLSLFVAFIHEIMANQRGNQSAEQPKGLALEPSARSGHERLSPSGYLWVLVPDERCAWL